MKSLVVIIGPNGVGKSTACQGLFSQTPNSCLLQSEWCRSINPFVFTQEIEALTAVNMAMLIENYLDCSLVQTIFMAYGFHGPRKQIFENVLTKLQNHDFQLLLITLTCSVEENIRRMREDGRSEERIRSALENSRSVYSDMSNPCIDTTHLSPHQTIERVLTILGENNLLS